MVILFNWIQNCVGRADNSAIPCILDATLKGPQTDHKITNMHDFE